MQAHRVIAVALIASTLAAVVVQAAVDCGQVGKNLAPCLDYLSGRRYGNPPNECCNGVRAVKGMVRSPADRRDACECVKRTAAPIRDLKDDLAKGLPGKCGVQLSVPISRNVDCSKI